MNMVDNERSNVIRSSHQFGPLRDSPEIMGRNRQRRPPDSHGPPAINQRMLAASLKMDHRLPTAPMIPTANRQWLHSRQTSILHTKYNNSPSPYQKRAQPQAPATTVRYYTIPKPPDSSDDDVPLSRRAMRKHISRPSDSIQPNKRPATSPMMGNYRVETPEKTSRPKARRSRSFKTARKSQHRNSTSENAAKSQERSFPSHQAHMEGIDWPALDMDAMDVPPQHPHPMTSRESDRPQSQTRSISQASKRRKIVNEESDSKYGQEADDTEPWEAEEDEADEEGPEEEEKMEDEFAPLRGRVFNTRRNVNNTPENGLRSQHSCKEPAKPTKFDCYVWELDSEKVDSYSFPVLVKHPHEKGAFNAYDSSKDLRRDIAETQEKRRNENLQTLKAIPTIKGVARRLEKRIVRPSSSLAPKSSSLFSSPEPAPQVSPAPAPKSLHELPGSRKQDDNINDGIYPAPTAALNDKIAKEKKVQQSALPSTPQPPIQRQSPNATQLLQSSPISKLMIAPTPTQQRPNDFKFWLEEKEKQFRKGFAAKVGSAMSDLKIHEQEHIEEAWDRWCRKVKEGKKYFASVVEELGLLEFKSSAPTKQGPINNPINHKAWIDEKEKQFKRNYASVIAVATSGMDSEVETQVTEAWEMWLMKFWDGKDYFKSVVASFGLLEVGNKRATGKAKGNNDVAMTY